MKCTYCGNTEFYEGPQAGMSVNILCANPKCRHWFYYLSSFDKLEDLNKIEPSDEEKEKQKLERQAARDALPDKLITEGMDCYKEDKPITAIFVSKPEWHTVSGADLWRIAGYIKAMKEAQHE